MKSDLIKILATTDRGFPALHEWLDEFKQKEQSVLDESFRPEWLDKARDARAKIEMINMLSEDVAEAEDPKKRIER